MANYRIVALAVIALISVSFLNPRVEAADPAGVKMEGGKMMIMKDGKATEPMTQEMTMTDGSKVMPDGTVKTKDGNQHRMKEGQMMTLDGKMIEAGKDMKDHKGMNDHMGMKEHKDMKMDEMDKPK